MSTETVEVEHDETIPTPSNWEFKDVPPTVDQVVELLTSLPAVWGVRTIDFIDYVQGLPQTKKTGRKIQAEGQRPGVMVDEKETIWRLYMGVAGRVKMLEAAQLLNGWIVEMVPEPVTPTGIPGVLSNQDSIVARIYVKIIAGNNGTLGSRFGTAWVPGIEGRTNAAKSNPYEKVETAAYGRALAAWGFGVLPGSGIASLEEVVEAGRTRIQDERDAQSGRTYGRGDRSGPGGSVPAEPPVDRKNVLQNLLRTMEEVRLARGLDEEESQARLKTYLVDKLGISDAWNDQGNIPNWEQVSPGNMATCLHAYRNALAKEQEAAKLARLQQEDV